MAVKKVAVSKKVRVKNNCYGWILDVPDKRDFLLKAILRVPAKTLPGMCYRSPAGMA